MTAEVWLSIAALLAIIIGCLPRTKPLLFSLRLRTQGKTMSTALTMTVGATHLLDLSGLDQYGNPFDIPASPAPTYASDTVAVATVSPVSGFPNKVLVTAIAVGSANVTAMDSASTNPTSNAVAVTVSAPPPPPPALNSLVLTPE
jgi:uncharacterized protein YjdB